MADVRATKNGNWSDPTVWNTGALPTTADSVFSNNFTVNVDTSFEVLSLNNISGTSITAGGTFNFNSGSISGSITGATPLSVGVANLITITHNTGDVSITTLNGYGLSTTTAVPVIADSCGGTFNLTIPSLNLAVASNINNRILISKTGNGNLNLNSNLSITGIGDNTNNNRLLGILAGNVTVVGTLQGPPGNYSNPGSTIITINQTSGNLKIIGNIPAPTATGAGTMRVISFSGTTFELTGSITGGSGIAVGANISATNINISGSVIGGSAQNALSITSAATINITGSISAGSSAAAILSTGAHILTHNGSLAASANSPAIISTNISAINILTGPFINNGNTMAVQAARMFLSTGSTSWQFTSDAIGVSQSLFTADQIPAYPSSSDVRLGTVYGSGSLTGTLAMPNPLSVQFGVPVDNTTGSAVLTTASLAEAIWNTPRSQLTVSGSIGERLQNVSTPATTGTQISSYLL